MATRFVLVRIDDRLIHGQVAIGWVKATSPSHLVVANDAVADDPLQRSLMEMAAPPSLQVHLCRVAELPAVLASPDLQEQRLLVLFATPRDALRAVEAGLAVKEINVGGMRFQTGKRQVLKAVSIDQQDAECFRKLLARNVRVTVQMVPTDEPLDIAAYL